LNTLYLDSGGNGMLGPNGLMSRNCRLSAIFLSAKHRRGLHSREPELFHERRVLLCAYRLDAGSIGGKRGLAREEIVIVQVAI